MLLLVLMVVVHPILPAGPALQRLRQRLCLLQLWHSSIPCVLPVLPPATGMVSSYVLRQSLGSQYQQQGSGGSNPLRNSLSASTGAAPTFQPMGALAAGMASLTPMPADSHLRASLGSMDIPGASSGPASQPGTQSCSQTSGSSGDGRAAAAAPTAAALVSSQLTADSPPPPDTGAASQAATAATSMVVHPMLSPEPSMSLLSLHSTKRGVITPVRCLATQPPLASQLRLHSMTAAYLPSLRCLCSAWAEARQLPTLPTVAMQRTVACSAKRRHPAWPCLISHPPVPPSLPHSFAVQSFTASPLDPQARLFNNPAYNAQDVARMSESKSVMRWVLLACRA